ncbi:Uu.00g087740.m01.CDS01 [Anthostomella pinea]|uniref:Uu.00g087740.m01.CDS01 n=1 Tax=Anthostomella pinea TaxID=933095 RepID=A0AAI8VMH3_9PEZI|nr:Uu.00g087740.m01.CDS01 [Anthostomella pinea]
MVVKAVHTGWSYGAVATLMQLDITGAFDAVVFTRLSHILWKKGYPMWIIRWIKSYINGRSAKLLFDRKESAAQELSAGVPKGSPASLILFLLYVATLYEELEAAGLPMMVVGFADDTNMLAVHPDAKRNCEVLEEAYQKFVGAVPQYYYRLRKHEASALCQVRTETIGLRAFLFQRRVPGEAIPHCDYGEKETAYHVTVRCTLYAAQRGRLQASLGTRMLRSRRDFESLLSDPDETPKFIQWFLRLGLLGMFSLARKLSGGEVAQQAPKSQTAEDIEQ